MDYMNDRAKRRGLVVIISLVSLLAIGAVTAYVVHRNNNEQVVKPREEKTDEHAVYQDDTPAADPAIVGKWRNAENKQWFKVYCDDYDSDGFLWGKEWNEAEDVQEEDLIYHGNGWFRWRKDGSRLTELHTMDVQDVPIRKRWLVLSLDSQDSLILSDYDKRTILFHFSRMAEE